ncbi:MAG: hypothetical protein RL701_7162 [Pseudomonadota bacterium]
MHKRMRNVALCWGAFFVVVLSQSACSPRARAFDVGIGTHFGQGKTSENEFVSWASATKVGSMRDEIYWDHVERTRGVYKLEGDALRTANVVRAAKTRGIKPLLVLDYGNPVYGDGFPNSPAARAAFASYAAFIATTLADSVEDFEVWNEWNLGAGSSPAVKEGSASDYVTLLSATSAALKKANPRARVIGGSVGDDLDDWSWMRKAIAAGMLQHVAAVSIHLYDFMQSKTVRGTSEFLRRIESLHRILQAASPQREIPILITEVGWPNHLGQGRVELLEACGELLNLLFALQSMPYVQGVWFYEFRDGGTDTAEVQHNFGFVTNEYTQKPVTQALAYARGLLAGSRVVKHLQTEGFRASVLNFQDGRNLLAIWPSADNDCKQTPVFVGGLPQASQVVALSFTQRIAAPRYVPARKAWSVSGLSLPQLFWIPASVRVSDLQLTRGCSTFGLDGRCTLNSVKCLLTAQP